MWRMRCIYALNALTPQLKVYCQHNSSWKQISSVLIQERKFCTVGSVSCSEKNDQEKLLELFRAIELKNPRVCSESEFSSLYQYLAGFGVKPSLVEAQFLETPDLLQHRPGRWKQVCDILVNSGLPSENVFKSIAVFPYLLQVKTSVLEQNIKNYSEIYIGKHSILQIVQRHPELYVFPPRAVSKRIGMLDSMFPPSDLKTVVKNNPNILTDDWSSISEKIMYIHKEMGLEQPHIAASECLRKSLLHIKTRHQFLLRAGLYTRPNLLRDKSSYKRNPPLSQIMDTSNRYFANKVARLSEYEYDVFSSMMKEEHDYVESDDESDLDDDFDIDSLK